MYSYHYCSYTYQRNIVILNEKCVFSPSFHKVLHVNVKFRLEV